MKTEAIERFLVKAREKCSYESEPKERKLKNGVKLIGPYREGKLAYRDRYRGFSKFEGRETVSAGSKIVWERKYYNKLFQKMTKEEIESLYTFLRKVLKKFPKDKPFRRGPDYFSQGGFVYTDECWGSMERFVGVEKIVYKGNYVYMLEYHGRKLTI